MDSKEIKGLIEAYTEVYASKELTEEQVWEEVEIWVNSLVEEGYDLSDYTWEEMYEAYLNEAPFKWNPNSNIIAAKDGKLGIMDKNNPNSWRQPSEEEKGEIPLSSTSKFKSSAAGQKFTQQRDASKANSGTASPAPKVAPTSTTPSASVTKPSPAAATSVTKPSPAAPTGQTGNKSADMATWAKANPKLAAASAERERTRGTSSTTNPLMKDMKSKLPAAAPKVDTSTTLGQTTAAALKPTAFNPSTSSSPTATAKTTPTPNLQKSIRANRLNMGFDLFDVVMGHLLDEGYADTEEAALKIMANMSEEWRQSIIEQSNPYGRGTSPTPMKVSPSHSELRDRAREKSNREGVWLPPYIGPSLPQAKNKTVNNTKTA